MSLMSMTDVHYPKTVTAIERTSQLETVWKPSEDGHELQVAEVGSLTVSHMELCSACPISCLARSWNGSDSTRC